MSASHRAGLHVGLYAVTLSTLLGIVGGCSQSGPKNTDPTSAALLKAPVMAKEKEPPQKALPVFVRPKSVRGIYVTGWSAGSKRKLPKLLALLKKTELNSMVIDVRDDGHMYFKNQIPLVKSAGAYKNAVLNPENLMLRLSKEGVYPIARIACFRDGPLTLKHPERAIKNFETGHVWQDRSKHTWLDPYNKQNWEYLGSIVDYALDLGFPEIQLDYVRFPSEGKKSTMLFPSKKDYENPDAKPSEVIAAFGKYVADKVHARGAIVGADVFGVVSVKKSDQGIGQDLETVAEPFDLICPMVYPSHYWSGMYDLKNPNANPYTTVLKALKDYAARLPNKKLRPWLQDFSLGVKYGKKEIQSQIKAARTVGYTEYLLWNAGNNYTAEAVMDVGPPRKTSLRSK